MLQMTWENWCRFRTLLHDPMCNTLLSWIWTLILMELWWHFFPQTVCLSSIEITASGHVTHTNFCCYTFAFSFVGWLANLVLSRNHNLYFWHYISELFSVVLRLWNSPLSQSRTNKNITKIIYPEGQKQRLVTPNTDLSYVFTFHCT